MAHLYLVRQNRDKDIARRFARGLAEFGHVVSWDENSQIPGFEWRRVSRDTLARADGVVVLLTENSVKVDTGKVTSQWIAAEVGAARATGKFVIPVVIGQKLPLPELMDDLRIARVLSQDDADVEDGLKVVAAAVARHLEVRAQERSLEVPVGYQHLAPYVELCRKDVAFDSSVFVMMKFPSRTDMSPQQYELLESIWNTLSQFLASYHLTARRADKKEYRDDLWENICVYMLSCRYGIAILEDRVASELNPNVTLEYGFMKALNRQVALLRQVGFAHDRADLTGKLSKPFLITEEGKLETETLKQAARDWLIDLGIPPQRRA